MNYKNCLSTKTRNSLIRILDNECATELFNVINGLCEEVEVLRREKLDKKLMLDYEDNKHDGKHH